MNDDEAITKYTVTVRLKLNNNLTMQYYIFTITNYTMT